MLTKLIELDDNLIVEVEAAPNEAEQISGGSTAARVESSFHAISPVLVKVCKPISNTWKELNKDVSVEQVEVEVGLSFEAEGNVYIASSKASANLKVKLIMKSALGDDLGNSKAVEG